MLKIPNGYGPNHFIRLAEKGEEIDLFGEGEERRDHVWIEDVSDLTCRILVHKSTVILNIVMGNVVSFREIAEQVTRLFPNSSQIKGSHRVGSRPHNGYRPFDEAVIKAAFPDFRYMALREGLLKVSMGA